MQYSYENISRNHMSDSTKYYLIIRKY